MTAIELFIDIENQRLVTSLNDQTPVTLPSWFEYATPFLHVYPVRPIKGATTGAQFAQVPLAGLSLGLYLGPIAGPESLLAGQSTWSTQDTADADGNSGYWFGTISLNTAAIVSAFTSTTESISTWIEAWITDADGSRPVWHQPISLQATVKDIGTPDPEHLDEYYTKAEALDLFTKLLNDYLVTGCPADNKHYRFQIAIDPITSKPTLAVDETPID